MKIYDKVLAALETFIERQREEVVDCIPEPGRSRSALWRTDLREQVDILDTYIEAYERAKRTLSLHGMDRDLLVQVLEFVDETDG